MASSTQALLNAGRSIASIFSKPTAKPATSEASAAAAAAGSAATAGADTHAAGQAIDVDDETLTTVPQAEPSLDPAWFEAWPWDAGCAVHVGAAPPGERAPASSSSSSSSSAAVTAAAAAMAAAAAWGRAGAPAVAQAHAESIHHLVETKQEGDAAEHAEHAADAADAADAVAQPDAPASASGQDSAGAEAEAVAAARKQGVFVQRLAQ